MGSLVVRKCSRDATKEYSKLGLGLGLVSEEEDLEEIEVEEGEEEKKKMMKRRERRERVKRRMGDVHGGLSLVAIDDELDCFPAIAQRERERDQSGTTGSKLGVHAMP